MKKFLFAVAALAWSSAAFAGAYHVNDELKCSQCHTMHASRAHSFNGAGADTRYPAAAQGTGHQFLLTYATINQTCLACHDAYPYIADVYGADAENKWDRSGGALNGAVAGHSLGNANDTAATAYADWMGHTLEQSAVPPGSDTSTAIALQCSNCHSVHGAVSYRNLRGLPSGATVTWTTAAAMDPTYDVTVIGTEGAEYATNKVKFGKGGGVTNWKGVAASPAAGMNAMCASCHGKFHGATGDATNGTTATGIAGFVRHPVADANGGMEDYAASNLIGGAQTDLTRPLWADAATTSFQVGCLTCHKGHGNARGYGLLYPGVMTEGTYTAGNLVATLPGNGAIVDYEQGDAAIQDPGMSYSAYPIRNLCATCHSQSRTFRK